ncbi:MAG: nucleotide exchange factor GrpE [Cyclobacteriaceae bacterium]
MKKAEKEEKLKDEEITTEEQVVDEAEEQEPTEQDDEQEEDIEEEEDESSSIEDQLAEQKDKYLRLYSEFENFRRRTSKEKLEMISTASRDVVEAMLPVLDDFERALKAAQDAGEGDDKGIELIYNKFKNILENKGLKRMEINAGDDFDDDFHEAITQIPAPSPELSGKIVDVVEAGYFLGEKVIRFAKVVTGAKE